MSFLMGVVLSALALFVWSAISWMALPWQRAQFRPFRDEEAIADAFDRQAPESGIYGLPGDATYPATATKEERAAIDKAAYERLVRGPIVFAVIDRSGYPSYGRLLALAFLGNVLVSLALGWMLRHSIGLTYPGRVAFVVLFGVAAGIACRIPDWNWHRFPLRYTIVAMLNLVIGLLFSGLVLARFVVGTPPGS